MNGESWSPRLDGRILWSQASRVPRGGTRLYRRHQRDVAQLLVLAVTSGDELDHGVLLKGERIEMAITPGQSVTFVAVAKDANGFVVTTR